MAFADRTLRSTALNAFVAAHGGGPRWDLPSLTAAALYYHSDLDLARAQLATARAAVLTAGARPNPALSLVPQVAIPVLPLDNGTYSANLDVPFETAGKRARRLEQAGQLAEASQRTLEATAWQVRTRLRAALLTLYAAQRREQLFATSVGHQRETTRMLEQRVQAGESSRPEALTTRLLFAQTELALADARKAAAEARASVAEAVGVPLRALKDAPLQLGAFAHLPSSSEVAALTRDATARRADLLAAQAELAAAAAAVRLEVARRYPDLHLLPGYAYDTGENKVELGFSLELPIFHQNNGPIAEARGRVAQAVARLRGVEAKVSSELDLARVSYRASLAKLEVADGLLAAQEKSMASARQLQEAGETDRLTLASAEVERDSTAALRLDSLVDAQKALGALEAAAQQTTDGWHPFPPAKRAGSPAKK